MDFDAPIPLRQAMDFIASKLITPTDQGSGEIAAAWTKEARQLALFSARTTSAQYLQQVQIVGQQLANGEINVATATMKLQEWLRKLGYTSAGGFPGDANVPPANTQLQNLASDARIKLVVETLVRHAANTGYAQSGMSPNRLYNWPCWEYLRVYPRRVPRGSTDKDNDLSWQERWVRSGGKLSDGRMIARKDDDVWENLSDSSVWSDGMDSDVPPFAFNSGYGIIERSRALCIELGVIDASEGQASRRISLLGQMFGDPNKATVADITAKRSALLDALASLKEAA